ncbi:uncharacterized protein LOC122616823 [Drosophila teissieri]|uniref:uncharacterized protein LOC122616823 n=1 Tax=Drosophila teissieri TaxID=7243 RepID=UPI001CB9F176|nr:uncharacterized protein LOC122616823 [Drosophila teissieri]XP_043648329.1 uncharacterized protein LOC122616823 [Drosophila teissieri]
MISIQFKQLTQSQQALQQLSSCLEINLKFKKMSRLLLQCRRTLLILRRQTAVENEKGLFSKLLEKCESFGKEEKPVDQEQEESKRS